MFVVDIFCLKVNKIYFSLVVIKCFFNNIKNHHSLHEAHSFDTNTTFILEQLVYSLVNNVQTSKHKKLINSLTSDLQILHLYLLDVVFFPNKKNEIKIKYENKYHEKHSYVYLNGRLSDH